MARHRPNSQAQLRLRLQRIFGERLRQARRATFSSAKCTQQGLAEALGVSRTTVSNMERGRHRLFLDQVYVAAQKLGLAVTDLLPGTAEIFSADSLRTAPDATLPARAAQAAEKVMRSVVEREERAR
jgi:transcriptional regulator with XRE-family HTH domain